MTKLYLEYRESTTGGEVREGQEGYAYADHHPSYTDWKLTRCVLNKNDVIEWYKEEVEVDFDVSKGDDIYVVYVRYYTGCTFGQEFGQWKIMDIFNNASEAKTLRDSIENKTYESPDGYIVWEGYFEGLEVADIEYMTVK